MMNKKTALLVGASGLVGNLCLEDLVASGLYEDIIVVTRKKLFPAHLGVTNIISDFSDLDEIASKLKADHVYCALGTTIAKAGSQTAFKKVDYEYPLKVATLSKQNGAQKFILVSAIGADSNSSVFYSKVKGKLEDAVEKLDFDSLVILQPSFLLGKRNEVRLGELIGKNIASALSFVFIGGLEKYKGIEASDVAKSMVVFANKRNDKLIRAQYRDIIKAADEFGKWQA